MKEISDKRRPAIPQAPSCDLPSIRLELLPRSTTRHAEPVQQAGGTEDVETQPPRIMGDQPTQPTQTEFLASLQAAHLTKHSEYVRWRPMPYLHVCVRCTRFARPSLLEAAAEPQQLRPFWTASSSRTAILRPTTPAQHLSSQQPPRRFCFRPDISVAQGLSVGPPGSLLSVRFCRLWSLQLHGNYTQFVGRLQWPQFGHLFL